MKALANVFLRRIRLTFPTRSFRKRYLLSRVLDELYLRGLLQFVALEEQKKNQTRGLTADGK